ncbi:MAG TPA: PTS sugar transporter subunit IIC [Paenalcaligenes sp.]|nr:PTS sugar transporter subunit IIC [Paenalcaligenes sp.]
MSVRSFLKQRNIEFSLRRYGVDMINYMTWGLFGSLIIGLIIKTIGQWTHIDYLTEVGTVAQAGMGAAIGAGAAYGLQAPPMALFTAPIIGQLAVTVGGGPVGSLVAVIISTECAKLAHRKRATDIIFVPAVSLLIGMAVAYGIAPMLGDMMRTIGRSIEWAMELQPVFMSMLLAVIVGMVLTSPTSSAALTISLDLSGLAAGAATAGCCAQMIGFAAMGYRENGWGGLIGIGLGTSMLQLPNIIKNPFIWVPPILTAAIMGPIATLGFGMRNVPAGAGMGSSGLVGQVGTLEAMGNSADVWMSIALVQFILPALLAWLLYWLLMRLRLIQAGDLRLPK